jgi:hypothetical protein
MCLALSDEHGPDGAHIHLDAGIIPLDLRSASFCARPGSASHCPVSAVRQQSAQLGPALRNIESQRTTQASAIVMSPLFAEIIATTTGRE